MVLLWHGRILVLASVTACAFQAVEMKGGYV